MYIYKQAIFSALIPFALLFSSISHAESKFTVDFLSPTIEATSPFYIVMERILRATAEDLDINLHIAYGDNNSIRMRKAGIRSLDADKPDYFLTGYYLDTTDHLLDHVLNSDTKIFFVTSPPPASELKNIGKPRGKYKQWIGQLTPDDKELGYVLADSLIKLAHHSGSAIEQNKVQVIAFGGFDEDRVSELRMLGLTNRIDDHSDAVIYKITLAGWARELAYKYTLELLNKNPSIRVIWATNDDMAIGCIKAAEEIGRIPGKDIFIGGVDLSPEAIDYIENGKQSVSVGGHFLEAAWSLVMLYDYHHRIDFNEGDNYIFTSIPYVVTSENVAAYRRNFQSIDWNKIDFKQFSKKLNPDIGKYNFSVPAFQKIVEEDTAKRK
jgi:ABC-type sugar transport system substrate-binding protein